MESLAPPAARARFRAGLRVPTAGWAAGFAQANLIVLPQDAAGDFARFARRNPRPCPLLEITRPGSPATRLAPGADLRTDLPAYRIWEHGRCVAEPSEITGYWRDDLVAFLTGCSFTFERALLAAGVPVRHLEQGTNVSMFVTDRPCRPAGRSRDRWSSRCGPCRQPGRHGHGGDRPLPARRTARLYTPVTQPPWASPTCHGRISAIR